MKLINLLKLIPPSEFIELEIEGSLIDIPEDINTLHYVSPNYWDYKVGLVESIMTDYDACGLHIIVRKE